MDIWGTKAARLQRELDQTREDLEEARQMIRGFDKALEDSLHASKEKSGVAVAGASILYQQNRKRKAVEPEPEADNG